MQQILTIKFTIVKIKHLAQLYQQIPNIGLFYKKENIFDKVGLQAGFLFTHFSNGRMKSPNSGINTFLLNVGLNYDFSKTTKREN